MGKSGREKGRKVFQQELLCGGRKLVQRIWKTPDQSLWLQGV
jgi:hypothetical protein